ncbi:MAG: transketolase [Christensenellales bacterium]|jgi:transketolase
MNQTVEFLEDKAGTLRREIIKMIYTAQSGHPGGSLSMAEVAAALYFDELNIDPENPYDNGRDRVVLSKGHCCPAIYAALAMRGYYPMETLCTLRQFGSPLQGHPDMKKLPGMDMTSGSLGQGLSAACGMAYGLRDQGIDARVFCIMGDGELQEGQIWEAAMSAAKYKLNNLIGIVDANRLQVDGFVKDVMPVAPIEEKFKSFGWDVVSVRDGNHMKSVMDALDLVRGMKREGPVCIVSHTVKGKGVSFMENVAAWHGAAPDDRQYETAMQELGGEA